MDGYSFVKLMGEGYGESLTRKKHFFKRDMLHFFTVDCITNNGILITYGFFFSNPHHSPTASAEYPRNSNFLPCLTPFLLFGHETWD